MRSDNLKGRINKLNAVDPLTQAIVNAAGREMDIADQEIEQLGKDQFFDTCSIDKLLAYQKQAGKTPQQPQPEAGRRSAVEAKWKSSGKVDVAMLQAVANSLKNGKVDVNFVDNKIQITFSDEYGLPADRTGLEIALDDVKPAHLPIVYLVKYLMLSDVEAMTLATLETHKLTDFALE